MLQKVEQTDEEILEMYMKCEKEELAKMLRECNKLLDYYTKRVKFTIQGEEKLKQNLPTFEHDAVVKNNSVERSNTFDFIIGVAEMATSLFYIAIMLFSVSEKSLALCSLAAIGFTASIITSIFKR